MADIKKNYDDLIIINLYLRQCWQRQKEIRIIGIRYARMKRFGFGLLFLPVNVGEKKLKNDALNSIKGLSTTHC